MVGRPIADACLEGYHGTIFAYGQTGSGKTFTIQGAFYLRGLFTSFGLTGHPIAGALTENGDEIVNLRGVIPRTLDYVFSVINKKQQPVRMFLEAPSCGKIANRGCDARVYASSSASARIWKFIKRTSRIS
jgi:hypothetical protein